MSNLWDDRFPFHLLPCDVLPPREHHFAVRQLTTALQHLRNDREVSAIIDLYNLVELLAIADEIDRSFPDGPSCRLPGHNGPRLPRRDIFPSDVGTLSDNLGCTLRTSTNRAERPDDPSMRIHWLNNTSLGCPSTSSTSNVCPLIFRSTI